MDFDLDLAKKNKELFMLCQPNYFKYSDFSSKDNKFMTHFEDSVEVSTPLAIKDHQNLQNAMKENNVAFKVFQQPKNEAVDSIYISDTYCCIKNDLIPEGVIFIMPMFWPDRRLEANPLVIDFVTKTCGYKHVVDMKFFEAENKALEGRGTLMFDWVGRTVYSVISNRSHEDCMKFFVNKLTELSGQSFDYVLIDSWDEAKQIEHFHLSCFMSVFEKVAFIDFNSFKSNEQKELVRNKLTKSGIDVISLTSHEMELGASLGVEFTMTDGKKGFLITKSIEKPLPIFHKYFEKIILVDISYCERVSGCSLECMTQIVPL